MTSFISIVIMLFFNICLFASDIAVVTLAVGEKYKDAVMAGLINKENYCKKQGYDFYVCEEHLDTSRPIAWSKILLIKKIMEEHSYKWIFWTDADSLIMNTNTRLEEFIDQDFNFIISSVKKIYVNSGEFFIKNCEWSKDYLKTIYEHTECIKNRWWEQAAICAELHNPKFKPYIKILPQRVLNARHNNIGDCLYKPGDFIIHFADTPNLNQLKNLMEKYSKEIIP